MARSFRSPRRRRWWLALVVLTLALLRIWYTDDGRVRHFTSTTSKASRVLQEGVHRVQRVIDGDTLLLVGGARVRLIGVDTPETVRPGYPVEPWGPEASEFTRQFVSAGTVRLELDRERVDRYGRYLAYVWVNDRMLNEALLRAGLGKAMLEFRYSPAKKRRFAKAEEEARRRGLGVWSKSPHNLSR